VNNLPVLTPTEERWRPIRDFEGIFEVSDQGNVRRIVSRYLNPRVSLLKQETHKQGYKRIHFRQNGRGRRALVHVLVAEAFLGEQPAGTQINHIDGDKANNRADNLEFVTPSRNVRHSLDVLGVQRAKGERNGMASLTDEQAQQIRMMHKTGRYKQVELARMFNTSPTVIGRLLLRKTWRHID
jgi:hypothetical protein